MVIITIYDFSTMIV